MPQQPQQSVSKKGIKRQRSTAESKESGHSVESPFKMVAQAGEGPSM